MCRSIRPLRVAEPPTTEGDVRAAALQFVRKVSGSRTPPRRNADAFEAAIDDVAAATARLLAALGTQPVSGDATPHELWPRTGRGRTRRGGDWRAADRPAAAAVDRPAPASPASHPSPVPGSPASPVHGRGAGAATNATKAEPAG